jgi:hypothetical protein
LIAPSAIEDIVRDIKQSAGEFSYEDQEILRDVYLSTAVPVDRFALDHQQLRKITNRFNKATRRNITSERLLWELMRMRKRGSLPALSRSAG